MEIRLFGGVDAVGDRGEPVAVGPAKCQAVLAVLALSPRSAVPVSRLVDLVWGEEPPRTAERTLQSYVTRLRKSLGAGVIVRSGGAYRLELPAESVDVGRFERFLDDGAIEAALAEWTGTPLAGLDAPGLQSAVDALTERWLVAVESDLERRLEEDPPAVIGPLTELTAHHPFREAFWALLMTALYRVGRQADALAAYRTARAHLVDRLGIEPGPRLRELEAMILAQDAQLAVQAQPLRPLGRPTGMVTFVVAEVEESSRLWARHGDAAASTMRRLDERVRALAERHRGYPFLASGDSFAVAFDRPGDAISFATGLQTVNGEEGPPDVDLRLRIGIHTGEGEAHPGGYFGPGVNLAARLAGAGHGGQTLLTGATAALLGRANLRDLGTHRLPGVVAEQRILQLGDGEHPALRSESRRGNLPRRLGRLIGRDHELAAVERSLARWPVVTLVGTGGIGKTRLALEAARRTRAPDGAWLIELGELARSSEITWTVAEALGVKERPDTTLAESIVRTLSTRRALLVLDNCEHVLDGAAELAAAIAQGCTHARVLATSREPLGIRGEQIFEVAPLDAEAAELFDERATAVAPGFDLPANRDQVHEICRRLDGLPLAIELAAASMRSLTPEDLLARLDDRLRLLGGGLRDGTPRQRTLGATIQWSYDLLSPPEQTLFLRLSAFTAPFDLAAAATVGADSELAPATVDGLLGDLVDRSMVTVESGPFGRRFRLLETLRQFATEHLDETARPDLAARHASWCQDQSSRIGALLSGRQEIEGVARLRELWPNLRTAVDWALDTGDHRLALALVRPIVAEILLRSQQEIGDWLERILALAPDDTDTTTFVLTWAARRARVNRDPAAYDRLADRYSEPDDIVVRHARAFAHEDYAARAELAPRAARALRERGDSHLAELVEIDVGASLLNLGRFDECDRHLAPLAARYREHGPPTCLNWTLMLLGFSAMLRGLHDLAERRFEEALASAIPERTYSPNRPIEARMTFRRGERARGMAILATHIDELLETDNMHAASIDCVEFINMMAALDRIDDASRMLRYLETTGLLEAAAWRTLVADAAERVARQPEAVHGGDETLDDRHALQYMRDALRELVGAD
ncbi:MAG: BTAD domain-containing putative transcriptional regulator [Thermoleophilia bacterium]